MFEIADGATGARGRLYKAAAFTTVATSASDAWTGVEGIKITATGSTIKGWFRIAGAWVEVVSATDATYGSAGYPGFWVQTPLIGAVLGVTEVAWGAATPVAVGVEFSSDQDEGVFTALTEKGEQGGADGWGASDGSKYQWALVAKRRERIRYRVTQTGAAASFIFRSLEQLIRPSGKQ
jgi:hypothetical protein